jgi:hypothetical protein
MNAARWFQRREGYQPLTTSLDSPFRRFTVSCLKCGSFKLQVIGEFDSDAGELKIFHVCPSCRECEQLPVCQSLRTATILRIATAKTVRPVSGFFPAMSGRDFPKPEASPRLQHVVNKVT